MSESSTRFHVFVVVTPGAEEALAAELGRLLPDVKGKARGGGVELWVPREGLWTVAHLSRLASSARVRVGAFKAERFEDLEAGLGRLPWAAFIPEEVAARVDVVARKSALHHTRAIAERVGRVLEVKRGARPAGEDEEPQARVYLRLDHDRVQVSVDATGAPLYRRGYRRHVGKAPLRETLAALLLHHAGWPGAGPREGAAECPPALWDPFCGSGTIPIEAAAMTLGLPAAVGRSFAFERWPTHDVDAYAVWQTKLDAAVGGLRGRAGTCPPLVGSDVDGRELDAATANAKRAGVEGVVRWVRGDFEVVAPEIPKGSWVVTNPPYGKRSPGRGTRGEPEPVRETLRRFGALLRRRPDLRVVALHPARGFESWTGLGWERLAHMDNRGLATGVYALRA